MRYKLLLSWLLILAIGAELHACGNDKPINSGNGDNTTVITPDEGSTLYGFVGDEKGDPIEGVVVSDGYNVVRTGTNGVYQMVRNGNAVHVFISVPSGYEIPTQGGTYGTYTAFYKDANKSDGTPETIHRQDFQLTKMTEDDTNFVLIAIGDPQPDDVTEVNLFRTETVEDIKTTVAEIDKPIVGISLGDVLGGNPTGDLYHRIKLAFGATGIPIYTTIGNHDKTDGGQDYGEHFRSEMGPLWYSFNRGKVHFVSMDNILLDGNGSYSMSFSEEQVNWLRKDLLYVPVDHMIVFYYHIPVRNNTSTNTKAILDMLAQYKNVLMICGHTHYFQYYTNPTLNTEEHILGAACGYFWRSKVGGDGSPNGYVVYEFDGTEIVDSRFKATLRDKNYQIRLFRGDSDFGYGMKYTYGNNYVIANVFFANFNGDWKVELFENGQLTRTMAQITASDMKAVNDFWIRSYHHGVKGYNSEGYSPCYHLFMGQLANAASTDIMVRATDGFGNIYEQTVFTSPGDYSEAIDY